MINQVRHNYKLAFRPSLKEGNLTYVATGRVMEDGHVENLIGERKLLWNEENRLRAISDNGYVSIYYYDGSGNRTVKMGGYNNYVFVNGDSVGSGFTQTNRFMVYPDAYNVYSSDGRRTKHIYIGSERIASAISANTSYNPINITWAGGGALNSIISSKYIDMTNNTAGIYSEFDLPYYGADNNNHNPAQVVSSLANAASVASTSSNDYEEYVYFYHSDHLGSTSYVTDANGDVSQYVEYVPFGEVFIEERNNTWNTPYLFNAKELDEETGLYYYGARYYNPRLSLWLSTDPMELKYPNVWTYTYCLNSPMSLIDPIGMNPIYGINGDFLGTDDQGVFGFYIIMNKNDFVQGMSHESALEKQYLKAIDYDVRQKIWNHHGTLDTRPDYDGYITISEGIDWAKSHPGALQNSTPDNTLYVDASKLNFASICTSDFKCEGEKTSVNLFSLDSFIADLYFYGRRNSVYALGCVDLILLSKEQRTVKIINNDSTDYDWNVGGGIFRNLFINLERARAGLDDNHGFKVYYYGIGKLNK